MLNKPVWVRHGPPAENNLSKLVELRCGNPKCGCAIDGDGQLQRRGKSRRLADVSYFCGSVVCGRCGFRNEVVVWDGRVESQEVFDKCGKQIN